MTTSQALPPALAEIVNDFQELEERDRLTLLLEFSRSLPALPERLLNHPELLEQVMECQSPLFLTVESEATDNGDVIRLFFQAPPEAPTTRGFASVLFEGLDGLTAEQILACPPCWAASSASLPMASVRLHRLNGGTRESWPRNQRVQVLAPLQLLP